MTGPAHPPVEPGQIWSVRNFIGARVRFRIDRIEAAGVLRAVGTTAGGAVVHFDVATLRGTRRGARLEVLADGTPASPPRHWQAGPAPTRSEAAAQVPPAPRSRARERNPRGVPRERSGAVEEQVRQLHRLGLCRREIGERLGLSARQVLRIDERLAAFDSVVRLRTA